MVVLTLAPSRVAPNISNIEAKMQACFNDNVPEPTVVPKLFATSLAPTANARMKPITKPVQVNW